MNAAGNGPVVHGGEQTPPTRKTALITCGGCDASWTALGTAHCSACHQTFASVGLFDAHRSQDGEHGTCLDPETVLSRDGERRLFFRDGMWRGPEMTAEAREAFTRDDPARGSGASQDGLNGVGEGQDTGDAVGEALSAVRGSVPGGGNATK